MLVARRRPLIVAALGLSAVLILVVYLATLKVESIRMGEYVFIIEDEELAGLAYNYECSERIAKCREYAEKYNEWIKGKELTHEKRYRAAEIYLNEPKVRRTLMEMNHPVAQRAFNVSWALETGYLHIQTPQQGGCSFWESRGSEKICKRLEYRWYIMVNILGCYGMFCGIQTQSFILPVNIDPETWNVRCEHSSREICP